MAVKTQALVQSPGNHLLDLLRRQGRAAALKQMQPVTLNFGDVLSEPGQRIRHVYFPTNGFISLLAQADDHSTLEVGLIGDQGVLGTSLVLGVDVSPLRAMVQGPGAAMRMTTADFKRELSDNSRFDRTLRRYLYVLMSELARASVCTRFHLVEARLARWLLMIHDCAHEDHFHFNHDFLATMLGVRRSGITIAAGALQKRQFIRYSRGNIEVLDRVGLESASCECYRLFVTAHNGLLKSSRDVQ